MATLCGSLSRHPVSLGSSMHLAGYRALDLEFTYVPFKVEDVAGAITGMRALGIRGFGVSYPFKQTVIPLLDELDPLAERIGAVNTIVNTEGRLVGHNTDWIGAVRALEEVRTLARARVLLLGAGGAARAIAYGLAERGAQLTIANRDRAKADELARMVGATSANLDDSVETTDVELIVNATSRGMADVDPTSPIPAEHIRAGHVVMDIVYKPLETELLRAARMSGAIPIHGGRMLLHQAARQFELYTGCDAPLEAMEAALLERIA